MSTRAATDIFKDDRDTLDIESRRARQKECAPTNVEEEEDYDDIYMDSASDLGKGSEAGEAEDEEDELSESELVDYGYEEEDEDEEHGDMGDDDTIIEEDGALDFADY